MAIVVLIGLGLGQLLLSSRPAAIAPHGGYRIIVSPHAPLGQAACRHELHVLGGSGATLCAATRGRPWIYISVKNVRDSNGYPVCTLTAYNHAGAALFDQDIVFPFGLPAGPQLPRGTSLHLIWYLPLTKNDRSYVQHHRWTPLEITRYRATCHGRPESEVPV
ncbi:MAG TPA: hypothetical protein VFX13_00980 [Gaiellales bacterium]|nr:hypothetical protein [Gaiellales bacterium]